MSQAEVFIVESLDFQDERAQRFKGRIISDILAMSGKACAYYYIRTKRELAAILGSALKVCGCFLGSDLSDHFLKVQLQCLLVPLDVFLGLLNQEYPLVGVFWFGMHRI